MSGSRIDPRPTLVLAAVVVLLAAVGALEPWPGLPHFVALTPLGTITDLQWLLVHAPGWPLFVVGVVASVTIRSVVLAATVRSLHATGLRRAVGYHLAVLPLAAVTAVVLFGAAAVLFYLLFWLGLAVTVALVVLTGAIPWTRPEAPRPDDPRLRRFLDRARVGTTAAYLVPLGVVGMVATLGPTAQIVTVPLSAALTLVTIQLLTAEARWRRRTSVLAFVPAAGVGVLLAVVATGPAEPPAVDADNDQDAPRDGSVILMSGIDSSSGSGAMLEIDPRSLGWDCATTRYYSYAGPGDGQPRRDAKCPIDHGAPYSAEDTMRPREEQVEFLAAQVADMEAPVTVIAHSQGAWIAWDAARRGQLDNARTLVLVGAFGENPVSYPPTGRREAGAVGRASLDLIAETPRPGGTTVFEPDSALGREWLAQPQTVADVLSTPLPEEMRALNVSSTFDLPLALRTHELEHADNGCPVPVIHPNIPYSPEFHDQVQRFLDDRPRPSCPPWRTITGPLLRQFAAPRS